MPLSSQTSGVFPVAATPFEEGDAIDWASVDRLTDFYAASGASGLTILGVMGEAQKLEASEAVALTRRILARAGKLPVIVGVSAPGFAAMRSLAREAMQLGAAGVMIAPTIRSLAIIARRPRRLAPMRHLSFRTIRSTSASS